MFGIHDLALFVASGLLLNLAPGPDTFLIMSRSASHGWRTGSVAGLGICSGVFVHILAATLGLSAVLATSATAFTVVKLAGAAYLLYLGAALIFGKRASPASDVPAQVASIVSYRKIFLQGFLTNVLNPKVAMFFLAFVPQFIDADAPNKALAFVVLGGIFDFNSLLWCQFLAVFSALSSRRVQASRTAVRWINRLVGAVFISFGIKLALSDRH